MMNEPRRLHPVAALLRFLRSLRELAVPLLIFVFIGGGNDGRFFSLLYIMGIMLLIVGFLVYGILSWYLYTYRIEDGELRIEHGVLVRKKRYIPVERIQTIDISAGIIQRLFGLVKVQVETAGGGNEAEAVLSAITATEAEQLRSMLLSEKKENIDKEEEHSEVFTLLPKDLFIMASTSGGIGVVFSAVFAFITQFDELLPDDYLLSVTEEVIKSGVVFVTFSGFLVLILAWIISVISTAIKYGKYTLIKKGNELLITRGLLEKRELTIPLHRVQAVRIQENIIRQLFGFASVYIEVAGGAMEKSEEYSTFLLPIVKKSEIKNHLLLFTPEFFSKDEQFQPLPIRARKRFLFRTTFPSIVAAALISWFFPPWGYISIVLIPLALLLGNRMFRESGWLLMQNRLSLRFRFINRHTVLAKKNRIQSFNLVHSFFQRKNRLTSIVISVQSKMAGKHFKVVDVDEDDGYELFKWYSYEKFE
ncbi:PH domain-containing protein [Bacillus salitolerans]|uniref:PH domain-containing protein n=1 Tax=Bacillus salitolerans TaxID=1437434 RepID=A0ABW4LRI7_9BACI